MTPSIHLPARRLLLTLLTLLLAAAHAPAQWCPAGSFESNSLAGWTGYHADLYIGGPLNGTFGPYTAGIVPFNNHTVSPAASLVYGFPAGIEGSYGMRIGDALNGQLTKLDYDFTVTDPVLKFYYNAFLVNPNHNPADQPYFQYVVSQGATVIQQEKVVSGGSPLLTQVGGYPSAPVLSTNWICVGIDLTAYLNQTVRISFRVADCRGGGHFGFALVDGICGPSPLRASFTVDPFFCSGQPIIVDGSASAYELTHRWTITPTDAAGTPQGNPVTWQAGNGLVGSADIRNIYRTAAGTDIPCDQHYRLTLTTQNSCLDEAVDQKLIYVECVPRVSVGPNICLTDSSLLYSGISIGDPGLVPSTGAAYRWSPAGNVLNPTAPVTTYRLNPGDTPTLPTKLVLTATSPGGCTAADSLYIESQPRFTIVREQKNCCGIVLRVDAPQPERLRIRWSNGQTGPEISIHENGTYTVTVTNQCATATASTTINDLDLERYWRFLNPVPAHQQVLFTEGTQQLLPGKKMKFTHVEATDPPYGRYSATHYRLIVFDRGGQEIRVIEDSISVCAGFPAETIYWDGKVNGSYVQTGVYNVRLYLKNCRYRDWIPMKVTWCTELKTICLDSECKFSLPPYFNPCGFMREEFCGKVGQECIDTKENFILKITVTP